MADINQEQLQELILILKEILVNRDVQPQNQQQLNEASQKLLDSFQTKSSTMAKCNVRFSGICQHDAVEEFIMAIETFKELENINDEDALRGISLLFKGTAALWWQGIKKEANTWNDCLQLIRQHFSPPKPPHQIYMDIFESAQNSKTSFNLFVIEKRNLLAQLPEGRHDETTELDLIYGLLNIKYRQFMRREDIRNFHDLMEKGRDIERNLTEMAENEKSKPKRCVYCNYRGHTVEECRRRQPQQEQQHQTKDSSNIKDKNESF